MHLLGYQEPSETLSMVNSCIFFLLQNEIIILTIQVLFILFYFVTVEEEVIKKIDSHDISRGFKVSFTFSHLIA